MLLNVWKPKLRTRNLHAICSFISKRECSQTFDKKDLGIAYVPREVEERAEYLGYFAPIISNSDTFRLILPPPNITGTLHLGHALTASIEDALVRWNRMCGRKTVWIPGIDHAGIATQVVVEKQLMKEKGLSRHDLGRKLFQKEIWKWKEQKGSVINRQLRNLGACLDWPMEVFTMNADQSQAVIEAFITLYERGLIYRSDYLVNWSCILQSAISDIEVEHLEISGPTYVSVPGYNKPVQFGYLTKFAYKLINSDKEIVVATTRPETMLGDVAIAVNPSDERYSSLIGSLAWHPFRNETIPIISDEFVDPQFGTGAVKLTPGHDPVDFDVGQRHELKVLQILDEKGNINSIVEQFCGLARFEARDVIINELARLNLLRGQQKHSMVIPICSRSKDVVESLIKPQWFVKTKEMATKACNLVKQGKLIIDPPHFEKIWFNWLENIHDWCISRQLWWGHQVPMYQCQVVSDPNKKCWVAARCIEAAKAKAALQLHTDVNDLSTVQDEDVLDTWFSSALLPFSSFGWPQKTEKLSELYPLSIMETGHDILFFWVSRMVMLGTELTEQTPFSNILLHGIVCDAHGRKMSKSLGNVISPEDITLGFTTKD